jgi:hypothetical protein
MLSYGLTSLITVACRQSDDPITSGGNLKNVTRTAVIDFDLGCCNCNPAKTGVGFARLFSSRAKHRLLGLKIDCGYRSRFKSASGGIKFDYKLAGTAGRDKPARPSDKLEDSHISACGRV